MSDSFFDVGGFTLRFPVYLLAADAVNTMAGLLRARQEDGSLTIPIFTDEDLAKTFRDSGPESENYVLIAVESPLSFLGLLVVLESKGFSHVTFDPTKARGPLFPIATVRRNGLKWFP